MHSFDIPLNMLYDKYSKILNMKKIIIGSTSIHKINAVRNACEILKLNADISGMKTDSGQNEQPIGFEETYHGALTRAEAVHKKNPDAISIGIESGIFNFGKGTSITIDMAIIVVITSDKKLITTSEGVQFPEEYISIAQERGFATTTVGSIISEMLGGDPTDPHSILTNGKISRDATLTNALITLLKQI